MEKVIMIKNILKVSIIALILSLSFTGCRTASIKNVPEQAIVAQNTKEAITNDDVFKAILKAGVGLGWSVRKVSDGIAEATLLIRAHKAVVTIKYDVNAYSILYKESANLKYNESTQTIHSNYNGWVTNLNNAIQTQLSLL
jgi:hypothetical protein